MLLVSTLLFVERHSKVSLAILLLIGVVYVSQVIGHPSDALRAACAAYTTYPTAYVGRSCFVRVNVFQTYASAINTCAGLVLAPGIDNGRLANIAQKRSVMLTILAKLGSIDTNNVWVSGTQVPNTGEPFGIWQLCEDAAQTDCYQIPGEAIMWSTYLPDPNLHQGPNNACDAIGVTLGNPLGWVAGAGNHVTGDSIYALCEFPDLYTQEMYDLVATGYQTPTIGQLPFTFANPQSKMDCAAECFKQPACVSFTHQPITNECVLQYIMYNGSMAHDSIQPQPADAAWNWYEPLYL